MQNILVPVDFSPVSRNAAIYAAELAKQFNAKLVLFHAYMLPTPVSEVPYVMVTADEMQKENEALIKKEADQLHDTYKIEVEWLVQIGIASDEIKQLAKDKNSDIIVMGMKGAGGLDKIIGSTTTNVIRKVKVPVLVIPDKATYQPIQHITYAYDLNDPSGPALFQPLLDLAASYQSRFSLLHVQSPSEAKENSGAGKTALEAIFNGRQVTWVTTEDSSVTRGISEYLLQHPAELLAMIAHRHNFFERVFSKSHTTAMAYETSIPLLILHDKE
ncbi:universal stress protein [Pseudobacter ginsenosidimutans]|nr:universal stress protein [Pseudobacter ginsenosidimutans]QEC42004.1 universal stress protein [Pseudobacter ginsenosidimutans]